jgi:hypothetical protein
MEASDRSRITSGLDELSDVTVWNEDLESGLVQKNVFNSKMMQRLKVIDVNGNK